MLFCFSLFCNLLSCSPPFPTLPLELEVELHLPSPSDPQTNRVAPVRSASNSCSEALLPPGVRLHYKSLHYWCCFQDVHVKALPDFMTHSRNGRRLDDWDARKEAHWNWKSPGLAIHEAIAARQGPTGKDLQIGRSMISEYLRSVTAVTALFAWCL